MGVIERAGTVALILQTAGPLCLLTIAVVWVAKLRGHGSLLR
jgi:hypothetical protein